MIQFRNDIIFFLSIKKIDFPVIQIKTTISLQLDMANRYNFAARMLATEERCNNETRKLSEVLPSKLDSNFNIKLYERVIHVMVNGTSYGLSTTYPPDPNMYAKSDFIIETALINANGEIVFRNDLEYEDVRRWCNIDELVGEFNRLRDLLLGGTI